jgi:hypothetical protein
MGLDLLRRTYPYAFNPTHALLWANSVVDKWNANTGAYNMQSFDAQPFSTLSERLAEWRRHVRQLRRVVKLDGATGSKRLQDCRPREVKRERVDLRAFGCAEKVFCTTPGKIASFLSGAERVLLYSYTAGLVRSATASTRVAMANSVLPVWIPKMDEINDTCTRRGRKAAWKRWQKVASRDWKAFLRIRSGDAFSCKQEFDDDQIEMDRDAKRLMRFHEVAKIACEKNGRCLNHASDELRDNIEIVKSAVSNCGRVIRYASERMKDLEEAVYPALRNQGGALDYVSDRLKDDEVAVRLAVNSFGRSIHFASARWKSDFDMIKDAVSNNGLALEDASTEVSFSAPKQSWF